jgi:hypothetical protein
MLLGISAIPWQFTYLEIGRIIGPIPGLIFLVFVLIVISAKIPYDLLNSATNGTLGKLWIILKKKNTMYRIVLGLALSFLVIVMFSLIFMPRVSEAGNRIDMFVTANANQDFQDYVNNVSSFLNDNIHFCNGYESLLKIDNQISVTLLDPYIMKSFGVARADLIVYQGCGTCGQAAILIEELLRDAGYKTRQAHFKNIDHQWAEVNHNGEWLIVDPWYIGNLVEAKNLKNLKPEFQQASGVEVQYDNGTTLDASHEHGY